MGSIKTSLSSVISVILKTSTILSIAIRWSIAGKMSQNSSICRSKKAWHFLTEHWKTSWILSVSHKGKLWSLSVKCGKNNFKFSRLVSEKYHEILKTVMWKKKWKFVQPFNEKNICDIRQKVARTNLETRPVANCVERKFQKFVDR